MINGEYLDEKSLKKEKKRLLAVIKEAIMSRSVEIEFAISNRYQDKLRRAGGGYRGSDLVEIFYELSVTKKP